MPAASRVQNCKEYRVLPGGREETKNGLHKLKDKKADHLIQCKILDDVGYFTVLKFLPSWRNLHFSLFEPPVLLS